MPYPFRQRSARCSTTTPILVPTSHTMIIDLHVGRPCDKIWVKFPGDYVNTVTKTSTPGVTDKPKRSWAGTYLQRGSRHDRFLAQLAIVPFLLHLPVSHVGSGFQVSIYFHGLVLLGLLLGIWWMRRRGRGELVTSCAPGLGVRGSTGFTSGAPTLTTFFKHLLDLLHLTPCGPVLLA